MTSVVYFLQRHSDGAIKIGCSGNFGLRLQTHRSQWKALTVLGAIAGDKRTEAQIHAEFKDAQLSFDGSREWFVPTPRLLSFIFRNASLSLTDTKPYHKYPATIVVQKPTYSRLKDFQYGLGADSPNDALAFLIYRMKDENEPSLLAALRLREKFNEWASAQARDGGE